MGRGTPRRLVSAESGRDRTVAFIGPACVESAIGLATYARRIQVRQSVQKASSQFFRDPRSGNP